jgi:DNA polymerase-3 subunit delta'
MRFSDVIGQAKAIDQLRSSVLKGRVPHAQLFVGEDGLGALPLALAYATYLSCSNRTEHDSCGECPSCRKYDKLQHPDLHFSFPIGSTSKLGTKPVSNMALEDWRNFIEDKPYGNLLDWYRQLGMENKQGSISVHESQEIIKSLSLKAYESPFKVMIIWHAERLNIQASNKLLKIIEEPPVNTVFLLITNDPEQLLLTIRSRTQILPLNRLSDEEIESGLRREFDITKENLAAVLSQCDGNFGAALRLLRENEELELYSREFVAWMRAGFKGDLHFLVDWSNKMAGLGREGLKAFLNFSATVMREAMISNYELASLSRVQQVTPDFKMDRFAPFIHGGNVVQILEEIEKAHYHVERNANARIVMLDLSIEMSRKLHQKAEV